MASWKEDAWVEYCSTGLRFGICKERKEWHCWPDYRKYLSPKILYIPHKWFAPQTSQKNQKKSGKSSKQRPSKGTHTLVEFKEKFLAQFFTRCKKCWNPFVQFHVPGSKYRYPCTQSTGGGGGPKIVCHCDPISLLINTFGIHLEPGCKSHKQIIHYRTAKNVQKQATVLLYF